MRACVLAVLITAMALAVLVAPAPLARANHASIAWSNPYLLSTSPQDEQVPNVVYNGSHGLYIVSDAYTATSSKTNITFIAERDSGPYGSPQYLYGSRPNDLVSGNGTAAAFQPIGLTVDHSGRVYVAWVRSSLYTGGNGDDVYVSASADGGRTWPVRSLANAAGDKGGDDNPVVRAAPDGRIWVAYVQNWGPFFNVTFAYSTNQGASFQGFRNVTNARPTLYNFGYDYQIDSSGRIHLVYSLCTGAIICTLYYGWSDDGIAWSPPVALVTGSGSGTSVFAIAPALAIQGGSTLHLVWTDSRMTVASTNSLYYSRSTDRGATWTAPVPINQGLANPAGSQVRIAGFAETVMAVWGGNNNGLSWAVSATGGDTWYPEQYTTYGSGYVSPALAVDGNGTFHAAVAYKAAVGNHDLYALYWNGPPDAPRALSAAPSGSRGLSVSWTAPPQGDVVQYNVYRSPDGSTYILVAAVPAPATSYTDSSLANGTYWYRVTASDSVGHESHDSIPVAGTVGPSLQDEINRLQSELNSANADLASIQAQLNALKNQLNTMQGNTSALQNQINGLQKQLDDSRAAQGTATLLLVLVIVMLGVQTALLFLQFRRPRKRTPGPPEPKHPEDEL